MPKITRRLEQFIKGKLAGVIDERLEPLKADLQSLNAKMDRILDINIAPEVLSDFRRHNEALRAIQADCDLIREQNPLFNSFLRNLMRLQLGCEEIARKIEDRESS